MVKILSIGNSFSEDAHAWLNGICLSGGIEIKTVCHFIGGCTFKRHWDRVESGAADYDLLINGKNTGQKVTFMQALEMEEWDIVTFNQGSVQSGRPFTYYPYLERLKELVLKHSPNAKLYVYQTWGYEIDADHPYFPVYNSSQHEMWQRARDCYKLAARILDAPIIPVGDVIQYLRDNTSEFDYNNGGLSLNRDGYHLSEIYGRYAAALTFYAVLFGGDVLNNGFVPVIEGKETDERLIEVIKKAVLEVISREPDVDDD